MILLTTGSRWWNDPVTLFERMDEWLRVALIASPVKLLVVHGACPVSPVGTGADYLVDRWAAQHPEHVVVERWPAAWDICQRGRGPAFCPDDDGAHRQVRRSDDWAHPGHEATLCPKAGPRRNNAMVGRVHNLLAERQHRAARVLGFVRPAVPCRGTRGCMDAASRAKLDVVRPAYESDRRPRPWPIGTGPHPLVAEGHGP